MGLVLVSWVFKERASGYINSIHCLIHILGGFGGSQGLDSMNIVHVFINRIVRFGSSQVLDYLNRTDCFIHRILGLEASRLWIIWIEPMV